MADKKVLKKVDQTKLILIKSNKSAIKGKDLKELTSAELATHLHCIGLPDKWCLGFLNGDINGAKWLLMKPNWLFCIENKDFKFEYKEIEKMNESIDNYHNQNAKKMVKKQKDKKQEKEGNKKPGKRVNNELNEHGFGIKDKYGKDKKRRKPARRVVADSESDNADMDWDFIKSETWINKKEKKKFVKINWKLGALHMFRDLKDKTCAKINWKEVESKYETWVISLKKRDKNMVKRYYICLYIYFQYHICFI